MDIVTLISEPLAYQFMQRAMLSALIVGLLSGVIGSFVVVRGMSFLGDALAHSVLPGVAGAYLVAGGHGNQRVCGWVGDGDFHRTTHRLADARQTHERRYRHRHRVCGVVRLGHCYD